MEGNDENLVPVPEGRKIIPSYELFFICMLGLPCNSKKNIENGVNKNYEKIRILEEIVDFGSVFFRNCSGNLVICLYLDRRISPKIYL